MEVMNEQYDYPPEWDELNICEKCGQVQDWIDYCECEEEEDED